MASFHVTTQKPLVTKTDEAEILVLIIYLFIDRKTHRMLVVGRGYR